MDLKHTKDVLGALLFYNKKPIHPTRVASPFATMLEYNTAYKAWAKEFENLKSEAIKKATE